MPQILATYSREEVRKHTSLGDIWIVLHNKVYNVTSYIEDHPGGAPILLETAGSDATEAFEYAGHSDDARETMQSYYIGDVRPEEHTGNLEIYRPTFRAVSFMPTGITSRYLLQTRWTRLLKVTMLAIGGVMGISLFSGTSSSGILSSMGRGLNWFRAEGASPISFWYGFLIATTGQLLFILALLTWVISRLDVQKEFSRYPPYRPMRVYMSTAQESSSSYRTAAYNVLSRTI